MVTKIQHSARIIGSLGGRPPHLRPPAHPHHPFHYKKAEVFYRGGHSETFYLLQEDGIFRIILEDGTGFLELEH